MVYSYDLQQHVKQNGINENVLNASDTNEYSCEKKSMEMGMPISALKILFVA